MRCVGVDGCPGGWVGVVLGDQGVIGAVHGATLAELAAQVPDADGFGVDIPIGLPVGGQRRADVAARRLLGARRSSVFATPVREALLAPTAQEANTVSRRLTGHGLSRQAYALAPKILEADDWVAHAGVPVWEVHPEVSFAVLLGHPARAAKKTWSGLRERLAVLHRAGVELADMEGVGPRAGVDDVVDAAAAAWSTGRLVRGDGISLPDPPDIDPVTGRAVAIWA